MAIAYVSRKSTESESGLKEISVERPAGSAKGNALVMIVALHNASESETAFGTSTLEKKLDKFTTGWGRVGVFVGVDDGSTSPVVKWAGASGAEAVLLSFSGAAPVPYDVGSIANPATTKEPNIASITTAHANEMLIAINVIKEWGAAEASPPAGLTERFDSAEEGVFGMHIATGLQEAAGATGTKHFTFGTSQAVTAAMLALKPPEETVWTESASGTLLLSGSAVEVFDSSDSPSTTLKVEGSEVEVLDSSDSPAGVVKAEGTGAEVLDASEAPSGTLKAEGAEAEAASFADSPTGEAKLVGGAVEAEGGVEAAAGVLRLVGGASEAFTGAKPPPSIIQTIDAGAGTGYGAGTGVSVPAEAEEGDLLLLGFALSAEADVLKLPAGFTRIGEPVLQLLGAEPMQVVYAWGVVDGSSPAVSWDGVNRDWGYSIVALRNCKNSDPIADFSLNPSSEVTKFEAAPSVTADVDSCALIMFGDDLTTEVGEGPLVSAVPAGLSSELNVNAFFIGYNNSIPAGASGEKIATLASDAANVGALFAIRPALPPVNLVTPSLSGTPAVGETLTCDPGTWEGLPSFLYQWQISDSPTTGFVGLIGETVSTYKVETRDRGRYFRCVVTAVNLGGEVPAASDILGVAGRAVPAKIFSGDAIADYLVQAAEGAVTEVPDPLGSGSTVFKLTVNNADVAPVTPTLDPRAQLAAPQLRVTKDGRRFYAFVDGSEFWAKCGLLFPEGFPTTIPSWFQLFQLFGAPFEEVTPWGLQVKSNLELAWHRNETYGFDAPWEEVFFEPNKWIDILLHYRLAKDGWVEMWINGSQITFFQPGFHNPNKEEETTRLQMETLDATNNGPNGNAFFLQSYRELDMFPGDVTMYHKPLEIWLGLQRQPVNLKSGGTFAPFNRSARVGGSF